MMRSNELGRKNRQNNNGARTHLASMTGKFHQGRLFCLDRVFTEFWARVERTGREPSLQDLLACERELFQAADATEADLRPDNLAACRRNTLSGLTGDLRTDYSDLLCGIGRHLSNEGRHTEARTALSVFAVAGRSDWYGLKCLAVAVGCGGSAREALAYFKMAKDALPRYGAIEKELDPAEVWEADAFEARFQAIVAASEDRKISVESLAEIVEPIMNPSEGLEGISGVQAQQKELVFMALRDLGIPNVVLLPVFGRQLPGEGENSSVLISLMKAAATNGVSVETANDLYDRFGAQACSLYVEFSVRQLNHRQVTRESLAEERSTVATLLAEEKLVGEAVSVIEARLTELLGIIARREKLVDLDPQIVAVEAQITNEKTVVAGILAAQKLWQTKEALRPSLQRLFRRCLADQTKKRALKVLFKQVRRDLDLAMETAVTIVNQKRAGKKKPPAIAKLLAAVAFPVREESLRRAQKYHDFLFVTLGDLSEVAQFYREVDRRYYGDPVCLESVWYQLLSAKADKPKRIIALAEKSFEVSAGQNVVVAMQLMEQQLASSVVSEKEAVLAELEGFVLESTDEGCSLARLHAANLLMGQLKQQSNDMFFAVNNPQRPSVLSELAVKADKVRAVLGTRLDSLRGLDYQSWEKIHGDMGLVYFFAFRIMEAVEFYGKVVAEEPSHDIYAYQLSYLHMCLGDYNNASITLANAISHSRGRNIKFYVNIGEPLYQVKDYQQALALLGQAETRYESLPIPTPPLLYTSKAQIYLFQGNMSEARRSIKLASLAIGQYQKMGGEGIDTTLSQGMVDSCQARLAFSEGRWEDFKKLIGQSIAAFEKNPKFIYEETKLRWIFAEKLTIKAMEGLDIGNELPADRAKMLAAAVEQGKIMVEKYPFCAHGYHALLAPLLNLGRLDEMLDAATWYKDNILALSPDVLANLIVLNFADSEGAGFPVQEQRAQELVFALYRNLQGHSPVLAQEIMKIVQTQIRARYADWEPPRQFAELFQFEAS